ncbi:hypothetical protein DFJ58DRAFT_729687 [Suillus subalutaceus]|uniref:uncharacterized protein n=1 Tax=Suillus subalutaceus TaxID=48586 RepID=UPI001B865345|nr:uncharacterized protein DFJ58DRAFT_729687 [Suillus subalutaceus]KAG1848925.1 hypothetical protein DFJ58DRAFT_729687 [Suillus subalutaceus]
MKPSGHRHQQNIYSAGDLMKTVDLYNPFIKMKTRRMRLSAIAKHNLHVPSEDEVFDTLQPRGEERTYNNPMMDCSSMDEYLDVMSAHDRLRDGNRLKTVHFQTGDDHRSLDLGFSESDDDRITNPHNHPQLDMLDMQFPTLPDDEQSNVIQAGHTYGLLEMGFNMNHVDESLDLRNNIMLDENPLEMGFDMDSVHESPLEMGFDVDPAHVDPDRSFAVIRTGSHWICNPMGCRRFAYSNTPVGYGPGW